ncbi:MAG: hypothetical protein PVI30_01330 [Myxococcales bacterium]|jgi:hypothetical protein
MTKRRLYTRSLLLLLVTAPWPFFAPDLRVVWGLPPWALYSLGLTLVYALLLHRSLVRHWEVSAAPPPGAKEREPDEGGGRGHA